MKKSNDLPPEYYIGIGMATAAVAMLIAQFFPDIIPREYRCYNCGRLLYMPMRSSAGWCKFDKFWVDRPWSDRAKDRLL